MPYYLIINGDVMVLLKEILILMILIGVSLLSIKINCRNKTLRFVLYCALIIQVFLLIIDNHIYDLLPGGDSRGYEYYGWLNFKKINPIDQVNYSKYVIGPLYSIIGERIPMFIGAVNIYMNILSNIIIYKILKLLNINHKIALRGMMITAFFPLSLFLRTSILRESLIVFCLVCSIYFLLKGVELNNKRLILYSFLYLLIGSLFHSGCVFIVIGYLYILLKNKVLEFKYKLLLFLFLIILFLIFKDKLLLKLGNFDVKNVIRANNLASIRDSTTGYLKNLNTTSFLEIVVYLPLFLVYFLFSPFFFEVRNNHSFIVFIFNSSIIFYLLLKTVVYWIKTKDLSIKERILIRGLLISFFSASIIFSIGTRNFGTAMRHRDKFLFILIIVYIFLRDRYYKCKTKREYKK